MRIPLYQIDAFTSRPFGGNPAAVCPLPRWLDTETLQAIAAENNLSETAFIVGGSGRYELRWFTPTVEVDLCGHATLASAYVVFQHLEPSQTSVVFDTKSGPLTVHRDEDRLVMDFPARAAEPCELPEALRDGLGRLPRELRRNRDYLAIFDTPEEVASLEPDFRRLAELDCLGIIATAPGDDVDFVSRFFAPAAGIDEDPVTGSAHSTLIPYWAERLGKAELQARQLSKRGGQLWCEHRPPRVLIAGQAVQVIEGWLTL